MVKKTKTKPAAKKAAIKRGAARPAARKSAGAKAAKYEQPGAPWWKRVAPPSPKG